jgi:hypothetical protein
MRIHAMARMPVVVFLAILLFTVVAALIASRVHWHGHGIMMILGQSSMRIHAMVTVPAVKSLVTPLSVQTLAQALMLANIYQTTL